MFALALADAPAPLASNGAEATRAARPEALGAGPGAAIFYRYLDPHGRIVIVDSLTRVPSSARASVETLALARQPERAIPSLPELSARSLDWPSFAAGAGCALLALLIWLGLRRAGPPLLRYSILGGALLLGAGAYFGWLRRVGGEQSGSPLATPAALIEEARSAVEKMNARTREQERVLRDLDSQR